jgi:TonB family protein
LALGDLRGDRRGGARPRLARAVDAELCGRVGRRLAGRHARTEPARRGARAASGRAARRGAADRSAGGDPSRTAARRRAGRDRPGDAAAGRGVDCRCGRPAKARRPRPAQPPDPDPPKETPGVVAPPRAAAPPSAQSVASARISDVAAAPDSAPGREEDAPPAALHSWRQALIAQIERNKRFPENAAGRSGVATIAFDLDAGGRLTGVRLVTSSGSRALDQAALDLIQRAQPFPAPPKGLAEGELRFVAPIRFLAAAR